MKNHLKFSFVILMAYFALAWSSSVVLEETDNADKCAPAPDPDPAPAPVSSEDAPVVEEVVEKQAAARKCPSDRANCYQTEFCKNFCKLTFPDNFDRHEECHAGGYGIDCDRWCRCLKGARYAGDADRCWCHCRRRGN